ncbi:hypothetical protein DHEL01_v210612 [Diaporthe helianthi]|uniref:AB hydrolase-1 domain-containing protein n=1 Tax=Diaporthe helianthi TaxID=158607 RepID=A0A2P5HL83_DIAHE|nr:hypothetical protein DHEL01_v210612 [Diaporthe helianthi]
MLNMDAENDMGRNNRPRVTAATCAGDISSLRDGILRPLIEEQQKDVIILAHSYGAIVASGAAKGLEKKTRSSQGQAGGAIGLIYVAGNIVLDNESLGESLGGTSPPFIKLDKVGLALTEPATDILYNDCDPGRAAELSSSLIPHAYSAFQTRSTAPAWADAAFDGRRAYVRTLDDHCNPVFVQDLWLEKSKVQWDVVDLKTGHMPFVSQPAALAAEVIKFAKGFVAL